MKYESNPLWMQYLASLFAIIQAILISFKLLGANYSWSVALLPVTIIAGMFIIFTVVLFWMFHNWKTDEDDNYFE